MTNDKLAKLALKRERRRALLEAAMRQKDGMPPLESEPEPPKVASTLGCTDEELSRVLGQFWEG